MSRFEIIYNDDTKVIIIKDHCEESDILKQWVDDYNNGKTPKEIILHANDRSYYFSCRDVKHAEFIKTELKPLV